MRGNENRRRSLRQSTFARPRARPPRRPRSLAMSAVRAVVAQISAVVPLYDYATAKEYAMNLLHVQVVLCALGASLSWAFAGLAHVSFGFA